MINRSISFDNISAFLSYSWKDEEFVSELASRLARSGVSVWLDKWALRAGDSLNYKVRDGIRQSEIFIPVITPSWIESKWCNEEFKEAFSARFHQLSKRIIPILLMDCDIPDYFKDLDVVYVDFRDKNNFENAFGELIRDILSIPKGPEISEIEWIHIPKDQFWYGREKLDLVNDERGIRYVRRPRTERESKTDDFFISKYPITNIQFDKFLKDGGYDNRDFWSEEGWKVKEESIPPILEPDGWSFQKMNTFEWGCLPVGGISWFEAEAFCRWAGCELPTEKEWVKSCRGGFGINGGINSKEAKRIYPWGNEANNTCANTQHSALGFRTPVDRYEIEGKSPYGVIDMCGNLWEWCKDWSDKDRKFKVLKGGSFYNSPEFSSCIARDRDYPTMRDFNYGFRVVKKA